MITLATYQRRIHLSEMQQGNQIHPKDFWGKILTTVSRFLCPLRITKYWNTMVNAEQKCTESLENRGECENPMVFT